MVVLIYVNYFVCIFLNIDIICIIVWYNVNKNNIEVYYSKYFMKIKNMCKLIIDCRLFGIFEFYEKGFNY